MVAGGPLGDAESGSAPSGHSAPGRIRPAWVRSRSRCEGHLRHPRRPSGAGMDAVFTTTVEGPWCYLEFGDVQWCRDPAQARSGAQGGRAEAGQGRGFAIVLRQGSRAHLATGRAQRQSNTAFACFAKPGPTERLFLALPSNGPARNSINSESSLLTGDLPFRRSDQLHRSNGRPGRVSDELGHVGEGRRAAADRRRGARHLLLLGHIGLGC